MDSWMYAILPLLIGWILDLLFGDPQWLPHPIVWFGKIISFGEHRLNKGRHRMLKGAMMTLLLDGLVFALAYVLFAFLPPLGRVGVGSVLIFFCLAGTTLIREVRAVFLARPFVGRRPTTGGAHCGTRHI